MKAYAIFDGGGVKGAALAGCLAAAQDEGIEFLGYGGTSAGSLVALLAAAGYSGQELGEALIALDFKDLLDDNGEELTHLMRTQEEVTRLWHTPGMWAKIRAFFHIRAITRRLWKPLGVYDGNELRRFVLERVKQKLPGLAGHTDVSFTQFIEQGGAPLKIVASNITGRRPAIFSLTHTRYGDSVIEAVRASAGYPFAFKPVEKNGEQLIDGGLSSNLPSFLFEEEYRETRLPTFAFDLIAPERDRQQAMSFPRFIADMLNTALEASDQLLRGAMEGVIHVPVHVPEGIETLDFNISSASRQALYSAGYEQSARFLKRYPPLRVAKLAGNQLRRQLMARYGDPKLFAPVLAALARDIETFSTATGIRANIMLSTGRKSRIVVYHYAMDSDPDSDLELAENAGCSGLAWSHRKPIVADLQEVALDLKRWKMSPEEHSKIPRDRRSLLSVPIPTRLLSSAESADPLECYPPIGTLTIDSQTPLDDTSWKENGGVKADIVSILTGWAYVVSRLLP